ncbi:MAG: 3-methyl-2-oxobutanoate hydroxymethyltransferase [Dehalococcoidia bacterium]|nr:3-methyl-2-oxobutanoate hydroxymethyltransferase [Dehalococcoidia bacterium]
MRTTISQVREFKKKGEKFAMLTAYDYATARLVDSTGVPLILVGDSLGMVILGYESTIPVTIEVMLHHTRAVSRGVQKAMVIGDLPFLSYHLNAEQALASAGRFLQEAGAQAIKLEGGVNVADKVSRIVECGIPVMGHIGLTPQSVNQLGGFKAQGKTAMDAHRLLEDAQALAAAGAFAVVLEAIPAELAKIITQQIDIPTIGIGAGPSCDGQVQVLSDILGMSETPPRHSKAYAHFNELTAQAVKDYAAEVAAGTFPTAKESLALDPEVITALEKQLGSAALD